MLYANCTSDATFKGKSAQYTEMLIYVHDQSRCQNRIVFRSRGKKIALKPVEGYICFGRKVFFVFAICIPVSNITLQI